MSDADISKIEEEVRLLEESLIALIKSNKELLKIIKKAHKMKKEIQ